MDELGESLRRLLADALGRAVRGDELRELRLQLAQLPLEGVVLLVADLGLVQDVVEVLVAPDPLAQIEDAGDGPGAAALLLTGSGLNGRGPG
jgi:hypothetical protein